MTQLLPRTQRWVGPESEDTEKGGSVGLPIR